MSKSQRWRDRRMTMVGNTRVIDPAMHSVDIISCYREAKPFIEQHHYSGSFPATRLSCGLFRNHEGRSQLVGAASFSVSMQQKAGAKHTGLENHCSVELGRLVLLDHIEANAESWFLSRAFRLLRQEKPDIEAVFSYSDPVSRTDQDGRSIMPGHVGLVYQALNAHCRGRARARSLLLMPNGRVASERALSKIRSEDTGRDYAEKQLLDAGAPVRNFLETPANWLKRLEAEGFFDKVRHPGNWVYAFPLTPRAKQASKRLPMEAYPKKNPHTVQGDVSLMPLGI